VLLSTFLWILAGIMSEILSCNPVGVDSKLWRYQIEDENFAAGCFGKVMLARDGEDNEVVIKKIPKAESNTFEVAREVQAGKILKHQNISTFREHFANNEFDFLIFDRVHGLDLFSIIDKRSFTPFKEHDAKKIFKQILRAIRHSHEKNIVHRDIKLENILMDASGKVTVIDYGLCDIVKKGHSSERFCGSLDYVAPEVLSRKTYDGYQADAFSLGIVLFTLLFAEFPFVAKDRVRAAQQLLNQPTISWEQSRLKRWNVSETAKDLIGRMLNPNPDRRLTLDMVKMHPWIRTPPS